MTARLLTIVFALGVSSSAFGQGDFYQGKQMRLIVGHSVGNDYDVGARLLAKYLQKHLPGRPTIIAQNMPQAQSIVAANYVYTQAPRDGTVFGSFSRNLPIQTLIDRGNIEADPRRYNWLGATSFPGRLCVARDIAQVKTPADLLTHELIVGSSGAGTSNSILPTVFNHVLGTKFRIIEGYRGTQDVLLAVERGEVHGVCATTGQFRSSERLIRDGKLRILFNAEELASPEFPNAPSIFDFAKTDAQRQFMRFVFGSTAFGRPYVFPPDVPADRVALVRRAFADAVRDPELAAEAATMKLDMTYRPPDVLERLVADLYATPPDVVEAVKKLVPNLQ